MKNFMDYVYATLPSWIHSLWLVFIALVILLVGHLIIKFVCKRFVNHKFKVQIDTGLHRFLASVIKIALYILLIYVVAATVGVPTASFVALIGSAGLAIGLALQGSLSNFAGGVLIVTTKPFHVGDYIIVQGGPEGSVESVDIFYTRLRTADETLVVVPNGTLANSTVSTVAPKGERRIDLSMGIAYDSDISLAKKIIGDIIASHDKLIRPQDTGIFVSETTDSAVIISFRCWAKSSDFFSEKVTILEEVKLAFDKAGIEIPFNQLDVHIKNDEK